MNLKYCYVKRLKTINKQGQLPNVIVNLTFVFHSLFIEEQITFVMQLQTFVFSLTK